MDPFTNDEETLDPQDWDAMRSLGHRMVDDMLTWLETVRERKVWQAVGEKTTLGLDCQIQAPARPMTAKTARILPVEPPDLTIRREHRAYTCKAWRSWMGRAKMR